MKKILLSVVALAMCAGNAMAIDNEPEEGLSFVGLFGMNISKLQNHGYNAKVGATMGVRADYMLPGARGTYLTAGVDWTMKGGRLSHYALADGRELSGTSKYALHYFEVPVRVGFRYNLLEELGIYGELGPYFAVGVGGRHKLTIDGDGSEVREMENAFTFKAFKNRTDIEKQTFQRWDAGIGFRVGAEYNGHYNLMFGCDWGLADIYRDSLRDAYYTAMKSLGVPEEECSLPKVHNFNFSITLGYRF